MDEPFAEYREVGAADPLRQGDVLEAVEPGATMWQQHLLVMTADCDFAHAKHQGRVTCVPLLAAEEYLSEMQIPKIRARLAKPQVSEIRQILSKYPAPTISDRRLREWASEEEPSDIVKMLELQQADAQRAMAAFEAIRTMDTPTDNLEEGIRLLVEAQLSAPNPPKRQNAVKRVMDKLREPYTQPPGDALFLTAISPGQDEGYFAYLRHIEQIWEPDISLGPSHREVTYRRISRMRDRFTHALVQRFAMVFMSIGLPHQYEEHRDLHADLLGGKYA
ncbi:hypothetical protein QFW82_18705 [Streptomyces malaysiensis subsp. malaysiensis]|uniref:hypothetical protein n=1 Tax=Streptomyces malaysiensis TaxID=92644 RepID=UPI0024BF522B|nr:hypothetical protein [Streptomyces sp. NA07423]WHX18937.1 hypothetical protein QFW82_18705 [Streptomyces sp. NA07423]